MYVNTQVWSLENSIDEFICEKDSNVENKRYAHQGGKGEDELGDGINMQTRLWINR